MPAGPRRRRAPSSQEPPVVSTWQSPAADSTINIHAAPPAATLRRTATQSIAFRAGTAAKGANDHAVLVRNSAPDPQVAHRDHPVACRAARLRDPASRDGDQIRVAAGV